MVFVVSSVSGIKLALYQLSGTPMETGSHLSQPSTPLSNQTTHEPTPPPLEMMIFSPSNFFKI